MLTILLFCAAGPSAFAMTMDEAWRALGLQPGADEAEVKRAHHQLVKKYHPDSNGGDKAAEEILKEVNIAKDTVLGKRAPTSGPGSAGPKRGGANFRDFGFDDFTAEAQARRQQSAYRPPEDAFVRRFFFQRNSELKPEIKAQLEAFVPKFEALWKTGQAEAALDLFFAQAGTGGLAQKVLYSLIKERSTSSARAADQMLKRYLERLPPETLAEAISSEEQLRLKGDLGHWPKFYPETTKFVVTNPALAGLPAYDRRRIAEIYLDQENLARYASFYGELQAKSPLLRNVLAKRKTEQLLGLKEPKLSEADWVKQSRVYLGLFTGAGKEMDEARFKLATALLQTPDDLHSLEPFINEALKITDFSGFELTSLLHPHLFTGAPAQVAARKELLERLLRSAVARSPAAVDAWRAAFLELMQQFRGSKGGAGAWEEIASFALPLLDTSKPEPTAEFRKFAGECAAQYGKISGIIGGVK